MLGISAKDLASNEWQNLDNRTMVAFSVAWAIDSATRLVANRDFTYGLYDKKIRRFLEEKEKSPEWLFDSDSLRLSQDVLATLAWEESDMGYFKTMPVIAEQMFRSHTILRGLNELVSNSHFMGGMRWFHWDRLLTKNPLTADPMLVIGLRITD